MRRRLLSLLMCVSVLLGMVPFTALASAPEDGLVAYYNFDGMQDGVVPDVTGNGHDGTVIGNVTGTDGKDQGGQGANFDGASYIEVPDDDALDFPNGDFTVAVWIKIGDNAPTGWHTVMQKGRLTETAWYGFFLNGNQINYSEDLQIQSQSLGTAPAGRWTHATAVHIAGDNSIRIFIDGKLVKVMDTCNQGIDTDQPLRIGYSGAGDGEYFQGDLDNLRIYNRALSDTEVEALYTAEEEVDPEEPLPVKEYVKYEGEFPDPAAETANIIYDTDIGPDYDDVAALAILHHYANQGQINFLGTVCDTSTPYGASCLDALNTYYGRPDLPVGTMKTRDDIFADCRGFTYNKTVTARYETDIPDGLHAPDAVEVYKQLLASQPDHSVTIVATGMLTNLYDLLRSEGGMELVAQKVKLVSCMGGQFPFGREFNIENDPIAAQYVVDHWPTPIVFSDWDIGAAIKTGGRLNETELDNPLRVAYHSGQMSWDLTSVLYAVEGLGDWWTLERGDVEIDDQGNNAFYANTETGARAYLEFQDDSVPGRIESYLDEMMISAKKNNPDEVKIFPIDDGSSRITGDWSRVDNANAYGGTLLQGDAAGQAIEVEFTGDFLVIYGGVGPGFGQAQVWVDGELKDTFDAFADQDVVSRCLYSCDGLGEGTHQLRLVIAEETTGGGHTVNLDFLKTSLPQQPEPELVAEWTFDDLTADNQVEDITGHGHNGELKGEPSFVEGVSGNAIRFDTDGELVVVPNDEALCFSSSDSYTINLWVKPEQINGSGYHGIIQKGRTMGDTYYGLWISNGKLDYGCGLYNHGLTADPALLDQWQMVTLVQDPINGIRSIYINGQRRNTGSDLVDVLTDSPLVMGGTGGPVIGGIPDDKHAEVTEYFKGLLDEVKLYTGALSAEEIANLYATENPNPTPTPSEPFEYTPDEVVKVIFDTDIDTDVDDVGALAVIHSYVQEGKAELLACVGSCNSGWAAPAMDAINTYFGQPDIPVGISPDCPSGGGSPYQRVVARAYENDIYSDANAPSALSVYRQTLAAAEDDSVVLIVVGMLNNLYDLLRSGPDEYSDLTGMELVAQKVKLCTIMGGQYPSGREWNLLNHPQAAQLIAEQCPVPVLWSGFEIGNSIITGDAATRDRMEEDSPVALSYDLYMKSDSGRQSWDLTTMLFAVEGASDYWTLQRGTNSVSAGDGSNVWTPDENGKDAILVQKMAPDQVAQVLNDRMVMAHKSPDAEYAWQAIDDADPSVTYTGSFQQIREEDNSDPNRADWFYNYYQATAHETNTPQDELSLDFTGNNLEIYGSKGPDCGKIAIYLDGQLMGLIDTYAQQAQSSALLYKTQLSDQAHTLRLVVTGEKNLASTGTRVAVDLFRTTQTEDTQSNIEQAEENKKAAGRVEELIAAIGTVTLDSEQAIADARAAYDALTEEQKALVGNYDVLQQAESDFAALQQNEAAAAQVRQLIEAIGEVTIESRQAIEAARTAYDALTEPQKALVGNYDVLQQAEATLAGLVAQVTQVEGLIDAIGPVTLNSGAAIADARTAYNALTEAQKAQVNNYNTLLAAEAAYAALLDDDAAAEQVEQLIDAIGTVTLDRRTAIVNARTAYDALTESQKAQVDNYAKLQAAEAALAALQADADAARRVEELIDAIGPVTLKSQPAIATARAAYDALTESQKALVGNYAKLQAAEAGFKALQDAAKGQDTDGTKDNSPKTGDSSPVVWVALTLVAAVVVLIALSVFRRRRQ